MPITEIFEMLLPKSIMKKPIFICLPIIERQILNMIFKLGLVETTFLRKCLIDT